MLALLLALLLTFLAFLLAFLLALLSPILPTLLAAFLLAFSSPAVAGTAGLASGSIPASTVPSSSTLAGLAAVASVSSAHKYLLL